VQFDDGILVGLKIRYPSWAGSERCRAWIQERRACAAAAAEGHGRKEHFDEIIRRSRRILVPQSSIAGASAQVVDRTSASPDAAPSVFYAGFSLDLHAYASRLETQ